MTEPPDEEAFAVRNRSARLHATQHRCYFLRIPEETLQDSGFNAADFEDLVVEAVSRARERDAHLLDVRVVEEPRFAAVPARLKSLGFKLRHRRVEYKAPLDTLPDDAGTPLRWECLKPAGTCELAFAAKILERAGEGDPDWDVSDSALEQLGQYLNDPALTRGPECVQIGHVADAPAGIVIAQVRPDTGWSRITYMGLVPEFRGKGLGSWAYRRGFKMLKDQGGKVYHGGTVAGNSGMERLFSKHGLAPFRTMQEWRIAW
ncbi:MAG: GNAT family N-acetyltransferase [Proteobacteria bacterium]|nr:GNAT family N-acetyltransferase [Pseudomonadota bacterium]